MNTIIDALQWRFATHKFDTTKAIPEVDLDAILEAGNLMPTSFGLQPFRFISITDQATKEKLRGATYGQAHAIENGALVVIAVRTDINDAMIDEYVARIEKTRGFHVGVMTAFGDTMKSMLISQPDEAKTGWATKQAYLAIGGMFAEASVRGVDSHGIEGFSPEQYDEILGLKEKHLHAVVILALGYRAPNEIDTQRKTEIKVRVPNNEMIIKI